MKYGTVLILSAALLSQTSSATAAGSGEGYAWADKPTQTNYTPSPAYSYNSSGKSIKVTRKGTGMYLVRFAGLGGQGTAGGHAQAGAYGGGRETCKIVGWDSGKADFNVNVICFKPGGKTVDTRFLVKVSWPGKARPAILSPLATNQASPTRSISAQGNVVFTYPDGRIVEYYDGGFRTTMPDGSVSTASFSTQAPAAIPVDPPTGVTQNWLLEHNEGLLNIINTLVGNDQQAIDDYLAFEGQDTSIYQKIVKRRTIISRLARP